MKDLTLSYSGGSGGFLLLHLLLLSEKYYSSFGNNSLSDILDFQWNINDHKKWKQSEIWPDDNQTYLATSSLRKLYVVVNPDHRFPINYPSKQLMLYTDIRSQLELAYFKKAHWFVNDRTKSLNIALFKRALKDWKNHYANIKDQSWPKCLSFRHINRLPIEIQQELLKSEYTQKIINQEVFLVESFKDDLVYSSILPCLNSADVVVKLQDVINSNGKILEDLLEIPAMNIKQHNLIDRWKKLHPSELLEKIGIIH